MRFGTEHSNLFMKYGEKYQNLVINSEIKQNNSGIRKNGMPVISNHSHKLQYHAENTYKGDSHLKQTRQEANKKTMAAT